MASVGPNQLLLVRSVARNTIVVAPAAGQVIADSGQLPGGVYSLLAAGSYGGTADVIDNMELWANGERICLLPVIPVANSGPIFVSLPGAIIYNNTRVQIKAIAAGGVGSVFRGTIVVTPVSTLDLT